MKKRMTKSIFSMTAAGLMIGSMLGTPVLAAEVPAPTLKSEALVRGGLNQAKIKFANETAFGAEKKAGITEINGNTYLFDAAGNKLTGLVETEEGAYYFKEDGTMAEGFVEDNGKKMYFDKESGLQKTGKVEEDGKTYILNENGETQSGWVEEGGEKFFLNEDGSVVKNETRTIDEKRYSFGENGVMDVNVAKAGYVYDANGVGTPDLSGYDKIAQAALAQVGVNQDCTMLVTNSLKAVGINFHGAPAAYLSLGEMTSNPVPGDIIVYQGHVAIYIGDGMAVHGGWNGYTTAVFSVNCSTPLVGFVHPRLP